MSSQVPPLQGHGGSSTCEKSWCEWLSLVLSFSPWLSLCPHYHPSSSFPPARSLLPGGWSVSVVGSGGTPCSWVSLPLGGGREGRGGAGEWLFVLECGVVQRAVEPLGMRDGRDMLSHLCACGGGGEGALPLPSPSIFDKK